MYPFSSLFGSGRGGRIGGLGAVVFAGADEAFSATAAVFDWAAGAFCFATAFEATFAGCFAGCFFATAFTGAGAIFAARAFAGAFFGAAFVAFTTGRAERAAGVVAFNFFAGTFFPGMAFFAGDFTAFAAFLAVAIRGAAFFAVLVSFTGVDFRGPTVRALDLRVFAGIDSRTTFRLRVRQAT